MTYWIPFGILTLIGVIILTLFIRLRWEGSVNKIVLIYSLLAIFCISLTGLLGLLDKKTTSFVFLLCQLIFLLYGLLHAYLMYRSEDKRITAFKWVKRNSDDPERDSFWPEYLFTFGLSFLGLAVFVVVFEVLAKGDYVGYSITFLPAGIGLILPLIMLKTLDSARQIAPRDYSVTWSPHKLTIELARWQLESVELDFRLAKSIADENRFLHKKMEPFIAKLDPNQSLGDIFLLAIIAYNKDKINSAKDQIQDIGPEPNIEPFWWLMKLKFIPWKPRTWNPKYRLLDPNASYKENDLCHKDVIVAKRMSIN